MKFVNVNSAKGLKIGDPVYTRNSDGEHGIGKLVQRTESEHGSELKFEVPQFFDQDKPAIMPIIVKNITHVCILKDRVKSNGIKEEINE